MTTFLKGDEGAGVTRATGLREVHAMHRASRIGPVQDPAVRHHRFERGRIAAVTRLATDTRARVRGHIPVSEMHLPVASDAEGRRRVREVAIGTTTLLGRGWRERSEQHDQPEGENDVSAHGSAGSKADAMIVSAMEVV